MERTLLSAAFDFDFDFDLHFFLTNQVGGAPLLALFEKWAAARPTLEWSWSYAAGGRIFILSTSHSFTLTGPASPRAYARKLLQRHSSGDATNPRCTGLRCM